MVWLFMLFIARLVLIRFRALRFPDAGLRVWRFCGSGLGCFGARLAFPTVLSCMAPFGMLPRVFAARPTRMASDTEPTGSP